MDPDDIVKREGPAAMEALLAQGMSLIEALWLAERDAGPLATPEDKAGLKQRLIDATETIRHPDIRGLYRRDLLDRFGALAYPARERTPRAPFTPQRRGSKGANGRWQPPAPPLPAENLTQMQKVGQVMVTLRPLLAAVLMGLIAEPRLIAQHGEAMTRIGPSDLTQDGLVDSLLALADSHGGSGAAGLETETIVTNLTQQGLVLPTLDDLGGMPYEFIARGDAVGIAESIEIIVELPMVESALAEANARTQHELTEQSFAEQQRLVQRRLALRARLGQMGRARAAL
jgi:DNA primase